MKIKMPERFTSASITDETGQVPSLKRRAAPQPSAIEPEFARCGWVEARFGVTQGMIYSLSKNHPEISFSLREKGKRHGVRLVNVAALRAYIAGKQNAATPQNTLLKKC